MGDVCAEAQVTRCVIVSPYLEHVATRIVPRIVCRSIAHIPSHSLSHPIRENCSAQRAVGDTYRLLCLAHSVLPDTTSLFLLTQPLCYPISFGSNSTCLSTSLLLLFVLIIYLALSLTLTLCISLVLSYPRTPHTFAHPMGLMCSPDITH